MRKISILILILLPLFTTAQIRKIYVSFHKNTHIFFDQPISYTNIGSQDVVVNRVDSLNLIALTSAINKDFPETNLTVILTDRQAFSFAVNYKKQPDTLIYFIGKNLLPAPIIKGSGENQKIQKNVENILKRKNKKAFSQKKMQIINSLNGVFTNNDLLYFSLTFENISNISYQPDDLTFFIKDKKGSEKASEEDLEKKPLYIYRSGDVAKPVKGKLDFVFVFEKFTIDNKKVFEVNLKEKAGDRAFKFSIPAHYILNSEII